MKPGNVRFTLLHNLDSSSVFAIKTPSAKKNGSSSNRTCAAPAKVDTRMGEPNRGSLRRVTLRTTSVTGNELQSGDAPRWFVTPRGRWTPCTLDTVFEIWSCRLRVTERPFRRASHYTSALWSLFCVYCVHCVQSINKCINKIYRTTGCVWTPCSPTRCPHGVHTVSSRTDLVRRAYPLGVLFHEYSWLCPDQKRTVFRLP